MPEFRQWGCLGTFQDLAQPCRKRPPVQKRDARFSEPAAEHSRAATEGSPYREPPLGPTAGATAFGPRSERRSHRPLARILVLIEEGFRDIVVHRHADVGR